MALPDGKELEIEVAIRAIHDRCADDANSDELVGALTDALRERFRVNVGLVMENAELRRRLRGEATSKQVSDAH